MEAGGRHRARVTQEGRERRGDAGKGPHLHHEALVVAAARLGDELVLQPAPLLVQLHHRVLAVLGQDWSLLLHILQAEGQGLVLSGLRH